MKRETGVSFTEIRRSMGGTGVDIDRAIMERGKSLAYDDRDIAPIRQLRREELAFAKDRTIFQKLEQLERLAKVWTVTTFGLRAATGVVRAMRRDWEGVQESLESLPFGVGALVREVHALRKEWSGVNQEIAENEKTAASLNIISDIRRNMSDDLRSMKAETARTIREIQREIAGLGLTGFSKELFDIDSAMLSKLESLTRERDAKLREIRNQISEAQKAARAIPAMIEQTSRRYVRNFKGEDVLVTEATSVPNPARLSAEAAINKMMEEQLNIERQYAPRIAAEQEKYRRLRAEAERRELKETAELASDIWTRIEVMRLEASKRTIEAIKLATERRYDNEIRLAREAGRDRVAFALNEEKIQALRNIEIEAAEDAARVRRDLDSEILQSRLRMHGLVVQAEMEATRQAFGERIRLAEEAGRVEEAARLRTLEGLAKQEVAFRHIQGIVSLQQNPALDARAFRGVAPPPSGAQQRDDALRRAFAAYSKEIVEAIERLEKNGVAFVKVKQ